jgi:hypothetical protein
MAFAKSVIRCEFLPLARYSVLVAGEGVGVQVTLCKYL